MMSVTNPELNARVSLRYAILLFPLSALAPVIGLTTYWFIATSSIINSVMGYYAVLFWKESNEKNAKDLFFSSLIHLPVILGLLIIHKKESDDHGNKEEGDLFHLINSK